MSGEEYDRVRQAMKQMMDLRLEREDGHADQAWELFECVQSPIEEMMGLALLSARPPFSGPHEYAELLMSWERDMRNREPMMESGTIIEPQGQLGKYRADFLVYVGPPSDRWCFAIECDGHDFHERTKSQAQRDKARDREFMSRGVLPLRFTGSEINKDPYAAAQQAYSVMFDHILQHLRRLQ